MIWLIQTNKYSPQLCCGKNPSILENPAAVSDPQLPLESIELIPTYEF